MITYLEVRNLAIVEELAIEPGAGLNVLTGETGAGKSLLIDSLEFLRGARGSTEMIRAGAEKMTAAAVFQLPKGTLEEFADDDEVIVKREISTNGRARVLVNGSPITVRELGAVMDSILEIHGQHDSQARVAGQSTRELLDEFGAHDAPLGTTREAHREWRAAAEQLRELTDAQRDRTLRLDLLKYQIDEIAAATLDPTEEESLRGERAVLANAREIIEATSGAFALVDDDENAAVAQLARALHLVQPLADKVADLRPVAGELQDALYRLQEAARTLASLSESVRHDPKRLDEVEERLVVIERLNKKYGGSIAAVLAHLGAIQDEFDRLSDYEANLEKLQRVERQRFGAYRKAAEALSAARKKSAKAFQGKIQSELNDLAMERTTVRIAVDSVILSREDAEADAAHRLGRRALAHPARHRRGPLQGLGPQRRGHARLRRDRRRHRRPRRRGRRTEAGGARGAEPGRLRHPPAADRQLRHDALRRLEGRRRRPHPGAHPPARRRRGARERAGADARRRVDSPHGRAARAGAPRGIAAMMKRWKSTDDLTLHEIAEVLARGGIVVLPTDTVYGLHASANNQRAVNRVAEMKGRSADKPFIVIAASIDDVEALGAAVPDVLHDIWPAPMTAILRRGDMTMAARVPDLDWLRTLLEITGPLASTSANRSGEPTITSPSELARDLQTSIDGVLDLGRREAKPSAIVDFTGVAPKITREGDFGFTQNLRKTLRKSLSKSQQSAPARRFDRFAQNCEQNHLSQ